MDIFGCNQPRQYEPPKRQKKRPKRASKPRHRSRVRNSSDDAPQSIKHLLARPVVCVEPVDQSTKFKRETIRDTSGYLQSCFNPCDHFVLDMGENLPIKNIPLYPGGPVALSEHRKIDWFPEVRYMLSETTIPVDVIDRLLARTLTQFTTIADRKMLLINLLMELKDTLEGDFGRIKERFKKIKTAWQRFVLLYQKYLQDGLSHADAYYLAYQFCILPLISDMKILFCSFQWAKKKFKWMVARNGKVTHMRAAKRDAWTPDKGVDGHPCFEDAYLGRLYPCDGTVSLWTPGEAPWQGGTEVPLREEVSTLLFLRCSYWKLDYAATGHVLFTIPAWRLLPGDEIDVWAHMVGLDAIASTIWEAIPFSFVVDWFTNMIKNLADSIDNALASWLSMELLESCFSFKLETTWEYGWCNLLPDGSYEESVGGYFRYTHYTRQKGLPSESNQGPLAGYHYGIHQLTLTAALASQLTNFYERFFRLERHFKRGRRR